MGHKTHDQDILDRFYIKVRKLHETAHCPSLRHVASEANCGRMSVSKLLTGKGIPDRKITLSIIEQLGGNRDEWHDLINEALAAQERVRKERCNEGRARHRYFFSNLSKTITRVVIAAIIFTLVQQVLRIILPNDQKNVSLPATTLPIVGNLHCALVNKEGAPVYRTPDVNAAILKRKSRQASVTYDDRYDDKVVDGYTFRAVRTPGDFPKYHWMLLDDLQEDSCGP